MAGHSARVGCLSWNSYIVSRHVITLYLLDMIIDFFFSGVHIPYIIHKVSSISHPYVLASD